jgi:hypothetical protein
MIVTMTRRRGDEVAPTISDLDINGLVVLERPRAPAAQDYSPDGKPHPCIPAGEYAVVWTENVHPLHPFCYEVMNVPGRSAILIHSANWIRELEGCLAPGTRAEIVEGDYKGKHVKELGVSNSKAALGMLQDILCRKDFTLVIKDQADS